MSMQAASAAGGPPKRSHHKRMLTAAQIDGRTRAGVRLRQIVSELSGGLKNISPVRRAAIERAAMACVIAEDLAARQLAGLPVNMDEVLRADGVARRAVAAIKAERPSGAGNGGLKPLQWPVLK
jgi:hypothetical protein